MIRVRKLEFESDAKLIQVHRKLSARRIADDYSDAEKQLFEKIVGLLQLRGILKSDSPAVALMPRKGQN